MGSEVEMEGDEDRVRMGPDEEENRQDWKME